MRKYGQMFQTRQNVGSFIRLADRFSLASTVQREMTAHGCDYYYECMPWPDGVAAVGW